MKGKIIQDPVHGYIEIEDKFMNIVDTIEFQRLKWIEQGSFRVLYPGARHDRFIHSLGTFFLAQKASESFFKNIKQDIAHENRCNEDEETKLKNTFLYAALLHDIGHAPFSHTCEGYFEYKVTEQYGEKKINNDLINAIYSLEIGIDRKEKFKEEYFEMDNKPSAHEIVSATILVNKVKDFLLEQYDHIDAELAARMVIGLTYAELSKEFGIKNCLIRLLNSDTVDVDKLDYISRDTKMTGFSNVTIDIERITNGVTAVIEDNDLLPAFRKNTLSVIDNVFRAKEEQGKWVISHPSVVYESELIKQCINHIDGKEDKYIDTVFSYEALGKDGIEYKNKKYKLLSDIDIISDFKKHMDNRLINEYFCRNNRRKAVWKSYQEYLYMVKQKDDSECLTKFYQYFSPLINYMDSNGYFVLNEEIYAIIQREKNAKIKKPARLLKDICEESGLELDLVLLEVKNNFISKISRDKVYIKFPEVLGKKLCTYNYIKGIKEERAETYAFFYLYSKQSISKKIFVEKLSMIMRGMRKI
ncbi:HD domain-containing protein [Clostridium botulinum]|uniref:HD domain-containing protein n=1 Tax=Clostridium botulinum TaxID=1491 RepID=UPI001968872B|nr:HD domain-containing protein [Clostridium botulinum]MBN1058124.1 HD domain-containing protein [Clostridium botulinum]MBN1061420.1 HD domain-containing protein [Clostridium botulinum]